MFEANELKSKNWLFLFSSAIVFIESLAFRGVNLAHSSYWIDEMSSVHFASRPEWSALLWDNSPPLYHLLLKIWMNLFGRYETATRSLSVIFSVATTIGWVRFAGKRYNWVGVAVFGVLHAFYSLSILHAREARMYSLLEMSLTYLLFEFLNVYEGRELSKVRTIVFSLLSLFSHVLAIIPIAAAIAFLIYTKKLNFSKKQISAVGFALLTAATLIALYVRWDYLGWQEFKFAYEPASRWPFTMTLEIFEGPFGLAAVLALICTNVFYIDKSIKRIDFYFWKFLALSLVVSTLLGFLFSRSLFLSRYFTFFTPLLVFAIAESYFKVYLSGRRNLQIAATAALVLFISAEVFYALNSQATHRENWRDAADLIIQKSTHPKVFTPLPLSMQSPYFEDAEIPFEKIYYYTPNMMAPLTNAFQQGFDVWLINSASSYVAIVGDLQNYMRTNGCTFAQHSYQSEGELPVKLFQLTCSKLSPAKAE